MSVFKVFKDSLFYGIIPRISTVINLILLPIITPYLTPYDYGVWGLITSYSGIILAIAPLGLNITLINSYYEFNNWKLVWGRILSYFYLSGFIAGCINIAILLFVLDSVPNNLRLIAATLGSVEILLFGNKAVASIYYPIMGKPRPLVLINLMGALASIVISFLLIYYFKLGFWGFVSGYSLSAVIVFLLFLKALYFDEDIKPIFDKKIKHLFSWLKVSIYVIPHGIGLVLLTSSSRILMSWFSVPINDIGIFSNGYTIGEYATVISTSVATALAPSMQNYFRKRNIIGYRNLFYMSLWITLCLVFLFSVWMPEIYSFFVRNSSFKNSILIASIISFSNVVYPFYSFQSTITFIEKQTKQILWLIFLPGFINIILCIIFIPIYGYKAAAITTLLSFWTQLLVPFFSKYHSSKAVEWLGARKKIIYILMIQTLFFMTAIIISHYDIWIKMVITFLDLLLFVIILKKKFSTISLSYGK